MNRRTLITGALVLAACIWAATVAAMYQSIGRFETTPGREAAALASWPVKSRITPARGRWTLVMLMHPHCGCTRASIEELERIIEMSGASMQTNVLVYRPAEFQSGWEKTDVLEAAMRSSREPGSLSTLMVRRLVSSAASLPARPIFMTPEGKLRFSGGITSLRGHAGINRGSMDIVDIVHAKATQSAHPVFGCAIVTTTESEQRR